jgi:tight adherence protein C
MTGAPTDLFVLIGLTLLFTGAAVTSMLRSRGEEVKARLRAITTDGAATAARVSVITDDAPKNLWERILIAIGSRQTSAKGAAQRQTLRTNLRHAGFRRPNAVSLVLGIRVALMLGLPALAAFPVLSQLQGQPQLMFLLLVAPFALGYLLPSMFVGRMARNRTALVDRNLPDTLDLLVLCMEAGLGLNGAIARVASERAGMRDPLGDELALLAYELGAGVPRKDALRNLGDRTGSVNLRTLVAQLIHTERLGGNVGPALRAQSESLRASHKLQAEELANKLPIKMLLPTVLFMPALFIAIIAPVAIRVTMVFSTNKVVP